MSLAAEWVVVSNPLAGSKRFLRIKNEAIECLKSKGLSFTLIEEPSVGRAVDRLSHLLLDRKALQGILIIGGDGTVHQVINVINQVRAKDVGAIPFGVIPAGTGNDFAHQCGLDDLDVSTLISTFMDSEPCSIDVISVNDRVCLQVLSSGFDARISERSKSLPSYLGKARYVIALLKELVTLRPINFRLEVDGIRSEHEALMISCASGKNYGGGMLISPESDHQDGILECIVLHPVGRWELLRVFPRIFSGTHVFHPAFEVKNFRQLRLQAATIAQGDGEAMYSEPLDLKVSITPMLTWKA